MRYYSKKKVLGLDKIAESVQLLQNDRKSVALCHGCFDIIHIGHLRHFEAAKALVDVLVVTVTPDRFVNKGPNRPVFPEEQRAEIIAGLSVVDLVGINKWNSAVETLRLIRPNIFIKGQEYETHAHQVNPNFLAEAKIVEEIGGKISFTYEFTSSTTSAIERLKKVSEFS